MCRDRNHGDRRCPGDNAQARRKRRKVAAGKAKYENLPLVENKKVVPNGHMPTMKSIIREAEIVSALLSVPLNPDRAEQQKIDAQNELLVTSLGNRIAIEAEKRAGYDQEERVKRFSQRIKEQYADSRRLKLERDDLLEEQSKVLDEPASEERTARLAKLDDALYDNDTDTMEALDALIEKEQANGVLEEQEDTVMLKKLSDAYKAVIADMRPCGGDIKTHRLDDKEAREILAGSVAKDFPSSWIEASNEYGPMVAVAIKGRPSYTHEVNLPSDNSHDLAKGNIQEITLVPASEAEEYVRKLSEDGDIVSLKTAPFHDSGIGPDGTVDGTPGDFHLVQVASRFPYDSTVDTMGDDGKPEGEGWKHGYIPLGEDKGLHAEKQWYRNRNNDGGMTAYLSLVQHGDRTQEPHSIAYHEFGHRMESIMSHGVIPRLEESFLKRRTTTDGVRDPLTTMYSPQGTTEMTRSDSFVDRYMGKEYLHSDAREVLSMGLEATYGGRMGVFRGLKDGDREDLDHRGFVLGILATV